MSTRVRAPSGHLWEVAAVLPEDGRVVCPPSVRPETWAGVVADKAAPFVIAPASERGWFRGRALAGWSPASLVGGLSLAQAAHELQRAFCARTPCLTVALLPYSGPATIARYTGGLVWTAEGWRVWGTLDSADVPALGTRGPVTLPRDRPLVDDVRSDLSSPAFRAGVRAVGEGIRAGNVYVLNLTRRLVGRPTTDPGTAFATLVSRAQADMAAFWVTPGVTIVSASPERFLEVTGDRIRVCPIKGTRPRAAGVDDDIMAADLLASEKERAEHVMIVDLERNDLGRVCLPGSVTADPLFEVVTTPYCHQMVSDVSGVLRAGVSFSDLLESTFPCGSVTGAPKIAAMRMISTLEASPRGSYTGSLVLCIPGEMDSSVLIRTAEYSAGVVRWGTGGGITIDSNAAEEWLETVLKASPFLGDGSPSVGLRETCRVVRGGVPLLSRHLARLAAGGCGPLLLARVRSAVGEALRDQTACSRISVTVEPTGAVTATASDERSSLDVPGGPVLMPVRCASPPLPAGAAKPAIRAAWDDAQRQATEAGAQQAILVDARGQVTDGATASVWVRFGRRLVTPPAPPAVDGIGRGVILDFAGECGYVASEGEITVGLLPQADEVFFSNALAGVASARGRGGPASAALSDVFREVFLA